MLYEYVWRLEADPLQTDLTRGFSAEVADPAWLLGRQWQLGEHQGEDASSPVGVTYHARLTKIGPVAGQPQFDPQVTPAEAVVESEPGDSWTPSRRVRAGRAVAVAAAAAGSPLTITEHNGTTLLLDRLPVPYHLLDGTGYDGRTLWEHRGALALNEAWFGALRPPDPEPQDLWDPTELSYSATFPAGATQLRLQHHDGGHLDWHSVDADTTVPGAFAPGVHTYPRHVRFPGAPLPRWWQVEDAKVDIGGYPPDRAHLATLLLIDLVVNQSDDWFTFPIEAPAGHIVSLYGKVYDSFGEDWTLDPPGNWSMFRTSGLDNRSLIVWGTAATPLVGPVIDEVVIGIDEDANLVWAVEQRLRGRAVPSEEQPSPEPPAHLDTTGRPGFVYRPMTRIPPYWHPYVIEEVPVNGGGTKRRRFVQGRAADLSGTTHVLLPEAQSDLLISAESHPTHQLEPAAIPQEGVRVERRAILARATDGSPLLWTQRHRQPLLTPPTLRLRFDAMNPIPPIPVDK